MIKRVISGLLASLLTLGVIAWGDIPYLLIIVLLVYWGILEYTDLMMRHNMRPQTPVMLFVSLLLLVLIYLNFKFPGMFPGNPLHNGERLIALMGTAAFFIIFINELMRGTPEQGLINSAVNLFGTVYIGFMFAYMLLLRFIPGRDGLAYVLFTLLVTWFNDTSAYFIGIKFGKHKLSPQISPKKSVEGSLAGLAGGILAALIIGLLFHKPLWLMAVMGIIVVGAGQFGDLVESIIKRNAGVKDSGSFLPGHGGVLDRIDSLLTAAPLVYYMVIYLIPIFR
jgi:phosphatidate cytidylyltransferase